MAKPKPQPRRNDDSDGPDDPPPAGTSLDRYEASMMLMIASRILQAYKDQEREKKKT